MAFLRKEPSAGYLHEQYARSLEEFGTPRRLNRSRAWILEREISGTPYRDAMGCYPLFACSSWRGLPEDLEEAGTDLVSLVAVVDPFAGVGSEYLRDCFKDRVSPFKEHFVIDLSKSMKSYVSSTHRRYAKRTLDNLAVEEVEEPSQLLRDWTELYGALIRRHEIEGIQRFSHSSFAKQLRVPGIAAFRALHMAETVGILLWYVQGKLGYYHLGAYNEKGYDLRASYALFWNAIESFQARGLRWLSLGGGAGVRGPSGDDGLSRFKRGWSTGSGTAYLCGRILDHHAYEEIVAARGAFKTDYFPAYRVGEFH